MDNTFSFTYSAAQQAEVEKIRKKYVAQPEESKLERLRKLDKSATMKARRSALILGILGALILGSGMSLCMSDLGSILCIPCPMAVGVGIGLIGMLLVSISWPVYNRTLTKARAKIAPEILRLSDELLQ